MINLAQKKRKDLNWVMGIIEQYDFYYKTVVMGQLVKDQQQEKNPNTRFILQLNF